MSSFEVIIPTKCFGKWGPEKKPEALEDGLTEAEYQLMRDIFQSYRNQGVCTAIGMAIVISSILIVTAFATGNMSIMSQTSWFSGIPFSLCLPIALSKAKAKVNAEILNPQGMDLQCAGCCAHKIVSAGSPSVDPESNVGIAAPEAYLEMGFEEKPRPDSVEGTREREKAPANYGTVELTHSSKSDEGEEVVRSLYTHISDGATRSERIKACTMKIVYVPEEDLLELVQVYNSKQMGELRVKSRNEDGARRCLRFFNNNGSAFAPASV